LHKKVKLFLFFNFSPEAQGVVCGAVFLIIMFLFIPVVFMRQLADTSTQQGFPHDRVSID
jgi:hypothetical protein